MNEMNKSMYMKNVYETMNTKKRDVLWGDEYEKKKKCMKRCKYKTIQMEMYELVYETMNKKKMY